MQIIGNDRIQESIQKGIENNNVSHAYIFSGPSGLGKKMLALKFATGLGCQTNDLYILEKNSPIKIDEVRNLQHKLQLSAQLRYKFAIIDDASFITNEAANALLKTLEEPEKNTILILITANKSKILPTIVSRCVSLEFNSVSQEKIKNLISSFDLTEKEKEQIANLSQGRPGIALQLAKNRAGILAREQFISSISRILNSDINSKFIYTEKIYKQPKENFRKIINLMISFFRDSLLLKVNNQGLILNQDNIEELKNFSKKNSSFKIINLINYLKEVNNAPVINEKLALENFFLKV